MSAKPLISIVTGVYNGARYLPELIQSVLAQDYTSYEHIVVDGGSTDDGATAAVLNSYAHLRWWTMPGSTAYEAQKAGIAQARGDLICLINADDRLVVPDAFSSVVRYRERHPDSDLIYGWTLRMDHQGRMLPSLDFRAPPSRWLIRHVTYVQHCAMYVSRTLVIDKGIELDPTLALAADWDWMIRLFEASRHIGYLRRPLAVFRLHPSQRSRKATQKEWSDEFRTICRRHHTSFIGQAILRRFITWRGMAIIALYELFRQGPMALVRSTVRWLTARRG
jgi:glycosyltransferase involved in cell wall biosynthesis